MSKPTVRKEERAIYTRVQNTCRSTGATTGTTGVLRSKREKAGEDVRKRPTGTTGLESVPPASAGTTGGRPVPPAVQIPAFSNSAEIWPAGTTGISPVPPTVAGTTGQTPVLPVVHFLAKLRRRTGTASTIGPEGRYYRLTLAEKKLPSCSSMQVCLTSAKAKL